ncbi:hypothetical protein CKO28_21930 [Rhodovibrio sodomensis]|uniref:Uncharacterized protein n=1 Tax=Rhodovibrio sodomensis TaxID=1088 RepID=A0ABS1DMG9_9PROT|nr:hypothetical protein [Rhodovibrio sodomensis]MBK1670683.1 hypothetical protein [Rhodovibrio sodomensis]
MPSIQINSRFPSRLAKQLRARLSARGVDLKQTEVLHDIAQVLGWRSDALQHYLKSGAGRGAQGQQGEDDSEIIARKLGMIYHDPEFVRVIDLIRADDWVFDEKPDGEIFIIKVLEPSPIQDAIGDEVELLYQMNRTVHRDPNAPVWQVQRLCGIYPDGDEGDPGSVSAGGMTLSEAMKAAHRLPKPVDQAGVPYDWPDLSGRIDCPVARQYRTDIRSTLGHTWAGMVYGEPVIRDGWVILEGSWVIQDQTNFDASSYSREDVEDWPFHIDRWRLEVGDAEWSGDDFGRLEDALLAEMGVTR